MLNVQSHSYHDRRHRQPHPRVERTQTLFTWVAEEEVVKGNKRPYKTEEWVREQRYYSYGTRGRREWEELVYVYGKEAEEWMRQEERARRVALEREKARARIQEELRKIDARLQQQRRERKLDALIAEAWEKYEQGWAGIAANDVLDFAAIPWPLIMPPTHPLDITSDAIVAFLFSPLHSQNLSRKDRIRSALLRWHPDRFRRYAARVSDKDRAAVDEGVGIVARCLNELSSQL